LFSEQSAETRNTGSKGLSDFFLAEMQGQAMSAAQAALILHKMNAVDKRLNGCADYCVKVTV
jgi:hypothetical protein